MKTRNEKIFFLIAAVTALTFFNSCSKSEFGQTVDPTYSKTDIPFLPTVQSPPNLENPPVLGKTSKLSSGLCASDSSTQILSCVKCQVPQITPVSQLSVKAQALLDTMVLACQVSNASDQNNFRPTREMILNKLNQASVINYPDSVRTAQMEMVVQGLTNISDSSLRQRMFGGLWYQPPYSDAFEQYFGITSSEAKSTFCWNGDKMNGVVTDPVGVYSIQWLNCQYGTDPFSCKESAGYVAAQGYRTQLKKSLALGVTNPYSAPTPDLQKTCSWNKFEGDDTIAAKIQLKKWLSEGRKVSMTAQKNGIGLCGLADESNITNDSVIEMATYQCD